MGNQALGKQDKKQISTVEELHEYLHVTNPWLWVFLLVVMSLIVGSIAYASTITLDNTIQTTAESITYVLDEEGSELWTISVLIPEGYEEVVKVGMPALIGNKPATICEVDNQLSGFDEEGTQLRAVAELNDSSIHLPDGTYDATITIESATPLSFMFN